MNASPSAVEQDLADKIFVITGGTDGIGKEAADALARRGARLLIQGRDRAKGVRAVAELKDRSGNAAIEFFPADFASLVDVRRLAAAILRHTTRIDGLINNAGTVYANRGLSEEGYELTFAVNHLAPFLLTQLLREALEAAPSARIVTTASAAHRGVTLDFDDLQSSARYSPLRAYGLSKLANILFTRMLARRLAGTRITATCLHPGVVRTHIARDMSWLGRNLFALIARLGRTPKQGAETLVYLAAAQEVQGESGGYYIDCKRVDPTAAGQDDQAAERLWKVSEKLTDGTSATAATAF